MKGLGKETNSLVVCNSSISSFSSVVRLNLKNKAYLQKKKMKQMNNNNKDKTVKYFIEPQMTSV